MKILFRFPGNVEGVAKSIAYELFDIMKRAPYYPVVRGDSVMDPKELPFIFTGADKWEVSDLIKLFELLHTTCYHHISVKAHHFELNITHVTPIETTLERIINERRLLLVARWLKYYL